MPNITAVGAAQPAYDMVFHFPDPNSDELPLPINWTTNDANYQASRGQRYQAKNECGELYAAAHGFGGGGGTRIWSDLSNAGTEGVGFPTFVMESQAAGGGVSVDLFGCRAQGDYGNVAGLGAGASWPSFYRVHHLTLNLLFRDAGGLGPPTRDTGVLMMPVNADNEYGWPSNAVGNTNRGGYGFVGDGAGAWQAVSYDRGGVYSLFGSWALPAHNVEEWNTFDFVTVCGGPNRDAYVALYFNGAKVMQETFAAGGLEYPGRNNVQPNEHMMVPYPKAHDQGVLFIGPSVCRWGRFLPDGTELTS